MNSRLQSMCFTLYLVTNIIRTRYLANLAKNSSDSLVPVAEELSRLKSLGVEPESDLGLLTNHISNIVHKLLTSIVLMQSPR